MNKEQFGLNPEQEDDDFPDEYRLDSYKSSDDLPSAEQCGSLLRSLVQGARQKPVSDAQPKKAQQLSLKGVKDIQDFCNRQIARSQENKRLDREEKKEKQICENTNLTKRAYDSLPHFYKIPMWKAKPYRAKAINGLGDKVFEIVQNKIDFEGIKVTALFSGGELGYQDRLVYIAVYNQAIKHEEFLRKHGKLYLSLNQIADEAGIVSCKNRRNKVKESLERLQKTNLHFTKGFGSFLTASFNLFSFAGARKIKEVQKELADAKELEILFCLNEKKTNREVTQIGFDSEIIKVICESNQKTTVDMWALQQLDGVEQTLFLYLYDWLQVNKSASHAMSLISLFELAGVELKSRKNNYGKIYIDWKPNRMYLEKKLNKVVSIAKFLAGFEIAGEKAKTEIIFSFDLRARQIPKKIL